MTETKKSNKKILLGVGIVVILALIMGVVYFVFAPKPTQGTKAIRLEVVDDTSQSTVYELNTDAQYLSQAMNDASEEGFTWSGSESEYGMTLETINGLTADFNTSNAYWCIYVNGEYGTSGVDSQVVTDGDEFQFVYTIYTE